VSDALVEVLNRELPPGEKLHGWRCEYPQLRPEPDNCARIMADTIRAALVDEVAQRLAEPKNLDDQPEWQAYYRAEAKRLLGCDAP
jgi:hypothetical protein